MRKRLLVPFLIACLGLGSCAHVETINPVSQIEYVDLSAESLSIDIGESVILTAYSSDSQDVSWVNGDSSVVQLQINGNNATVIGLAKGTSRITAIRRGKSASCVVTVGGGNAEQPITITLSPSTKEININDEFILTASVSGSNNAVTFSSSNTTVASVEAKDDKTARVKGLSEGMATIIAKVGTKTASCAVTVMDPSGDIYISLDRTSLSLSQGTSESLTATIRPIGAEVTWESNNESAATVENGVVYAVAPGNALISAIVKANGESRTATCQVTVTETGGDDNYDEQIANWSKTGHLYFHYLRKSDSDYDKWAIWAWPNYPDDGEGSLWGANPNMDTKGITPATTGWMTKADCGGEGNEPYFDKYGQVIDIVLDQSKYPGGVIHGGRTGKECPLIADYLWDDPLFLKAAIGFLIVDQTKMDGSDMWTSDGGAENYIKKIGKLMPEGKNGYLHVYAVEGNVSDFKTTSGTQ